MIYYGVNSPVPAVFVPVVLRCSYFSQSASV